MPPIAGPTRGCSGVVTVSTTSGGAYTAIGSLTNWSFDETAEEIDTSVMGACTKSSIAGAKKTSIQIDALWDGDNAQQALLTVGAVVFPRIYPEGVGSGANFYRAPSGGVTILGRSTNGNGVDGVVSATFTATVNGAMVATAVP